MPELPEVECGRALAERLASGRVIENIKTAADPFVFEGVSRKRLRAALIGRTVLAVRRRGKHIWFELDARPWPCFHFGMTGQFRAPNDEPLRYRSSGHKPPDRAWPPKFTKIRFMFDDARELAMIDKRRFARVRVLHDPANERPISALGIDPLLDLPASKPFMELMRARRGIIKGLLLEQSVAAGVGNWIADEVLYQAKIDPRRKVNSLCDDEIKRLRRSLKRIIEKAVAVNARNEKFPKSWLFHRRWGRDGDATTAHGEPIEHITVAGRTTAWAPTIQK